MRDEIFKQLIHQLLLYDHSFESSRLVETIRINDHNIEFVLGIEELKTCLIKCFANYFTKPYCVTIPPPHFFPESSR